MSLASIALGPLVVSRLILGSNPFSGISHQGEERNAEMRHYFTTARIKDTFRQAEGLGITTLCARGDNHIVRLLTEYWDEGGALQWLAQTCPELGPIERGIRNAINGGASACYIHGGVMDFLLANDKLDEAMKGVAMIKAAGLAAGIAGHDPRVFEWADDHLDVDFYMCCYYNPSARSQQAEHQPTVTECYRAEDRQRMVEVISRLHRPAIHYKVMAAGRNAPHDAFAFAARHLRPTDAVCVGVFPKDNPQMLAENTRLLEEALSAVTQNDMAGVPGI